ncbi:hypothetical protein FYK55_08980 [Roseiconus nitratireducens]|uniref:Aerotolerance regulator N-terminal domain-containing protein n=1 Tax=Roseiconus nitratireducens TaxID=2605748 RepID=A0A5M6DA83_9BACT|nr:BatA domain-containing protein [Roseiconus nitratireducens]KAA5544454.1 hypothetical protein FYK55_08980 [Roseiconus nitratireducens]
MSFLRLGVLWALPLVLTPLLIHWIHRHRHPTMPWAAMMFLRQANRVGSGPNRLRRWLILITRMLVLAMLLVAFARPLSSGAFGWAAGQFSPDATRTLVILDRSPSMQRQVGVGTTRLEAARREFVSAMETLGVGEVILIDSVSAEPIRLERPAALVDAAITGPADSTANLPELIQATIDVLREDPPAVADVWICSDLQQLDWQPDSPRWELLAKRLSELSAELQIHLIDFGRERGANASLELVDTSVVPTEQGRGVALSMKVTRDAGIADTLPVRVKLGDVTSIVDVDLDAEGEVSFEQVVNLADRSVQSTGQVSIPADVNVADDQWYFVTGGSSGRSAALVMAERSDAVEVAVEVAQGRWVDASEASEASDADGLAAVLASSVSLIWQGPLPTGSDAEVIERFLRDGGSALFFPSPGSATTSSFLGIRWGEWTRDVDLTLQFNDIEFPLDRFVEVQGDLIRAVAVNGQETMIGSKRIGKGVAWFCGADVSDPNGDFVRHGVVLCDLIAAMLDAGQQDHAADGSLIAGQALPPAVERERASIRPVSGRADPGQAMAEFGHHAGVYELKEDSDPGQEPAGRRFLAINRSPLESRSPALTQDDLNRIFAGVSFDRISLSSDASNSAGQLVRDIWTPVWILMIGGMLVEACLSLPHRMGRSQ